MMMANRSVKQCLNLCRIEDGVESGLHPCLYIGTFVDSHQAPVSKDGNIHTLCDRKMGYSLKIAPLRRGNALHHQMDLAGVIPRIGRGRIEMMMIAKLTRDEGTSAYRCMVSAIS
jgi:hypothetical protein